jgi:hypothetical protein
MGGQQSTSRNSKDDADCSKPCFFLDISKMTKKVSNRNTDAIGSPEPETPMIERRKRKEVASKMAEDRNQPAAQRGQGPFSSRYGGLEKEIPEGDESAESNDSGMAKVHEGPVSTVPK